MDPIQQRLFDLFGLAAYAPRKLLNRRGSVDPVGCVDSVVRAAG
jgi:hypothetical protein